MPLEIEAKIKVDSCEPVRSRLKALGARRLYRITETNRIFDTPDQSLFRRGSGLRVRTCRGEGEVPGSTLTFKGPALAGAYKSRNELETQVADAASTVDILAALGYRIVITFEKRREEWYAEGLHVSLDEVPRLGSFVEIEGPDEAGVRRVQERLGLADSPSISRSYIALLIDHARERGLAFESVTFDG